MKIVDLIKDWWRRRQHDRLIRARYWEWSSDPARHSRSPWIRNLVKSPLWNENVRPKGTPRVIEVTDAAKARGRDYVNDLLRLERCIRFRHYRWAWEGMITAMADDLVEVIYAEERERIYQELRGTCPDEELYPGRRRSVAGVKGMISGYVRAAINSLPTHRSQGS